MANTTAIRAEIRDQFAALQFGAPGLGTVYYISSVLGASTRTGTSRTAPLATLNQALALAAAGDTIVALPGHSETVSTAAFITVSTAGINIIGRGVGALKPTFTFSATDSQIIVSAASTEWSGCRFVVGINAVVAAMSVTGVDFYMHDCDWVTNNATMGMVLGILTAATATNFRVEGCRFTGPAVNAGTTTTACIKHEVGEDFIIRGCYFTGKMTQAILNATTVLRGLIDGNRFVIATGTVAITMASASTPFIVNNRINVPSGTAPIVAAAGFVAGNVYSAAAGVTAGTASTI